MTLAAVKDTLSKHEVSFTQVEYDCEKSYLQHVVMFPNIKNTSPHKVTALVIQSKNGKKDLELQFVFKNGDFIFRELWFGSYCYEMFDYNEEQLSDALLSNISEAMQGRISVIVSNNLKKRKWNADAGFVLYDDGDKSEFENAVRRIENKKPLIDRLFKAEYQYEIYNWDSYRLVIQ